jgi:hypothetical protein
VINQKLNGPMQPGILYAVAQRSVRAASSVMPSAWRNAFEEWLGIRTSTVLIFGWFRKNSCSRCVGGSYE